MGKYKLFVMDVDGTLTDGKIYMSSSGEMFKAFDIKDGYGIKNILHKKDIKTAIVTGRRSEITRRRAEELNVDFLYQNVCSKIEILQNIVYELGLDVCEVVYVGDDVNDLECIRYVNELGGLSACPSNAHKGVLEESQYVCKLKGGEGAVREVIDSL